jgi:DNA invertase Pin-like site-specific DNA recombinase
LTAARAALYARTSTTEQEPRTQLDALRDYAARRGWVVELEYVDDGFSGSTTSRPALDSLSRDARRGRFDVVVTWRLDRLGRSLRHLVTLLDDFRDVGVSFASVSDGIDLSTAAGVFQMQMIAAFAEYERTVIVDRVRAGLARARRDGTRIGRPPKPISIEQLDACAHLSTRAAAVELDCSASAVTRWRKRRCD